MNILVSACLLGVNCRYHGGGEVIDELLDIMKDHHLIPICPEQLGGLSTPRTPAERYKDRIINAKNEDVTTAFHLGAQETLKLAKLYDCQYAILKERSPSCGSGKIYDGSFSGHLTKGDGVTAELLKKYGICVLGESEINVLTKHVSN